MRAILLCWGLSSISGCSNLPEKFAPSTAHIALPANPPLNTAPPLAETAPLPPPPVPTKAAERYSVVVINVAAQDILFAVARDAKLNIEIHPNITGTVTMNLIDRTLPEILDAVSRQIDMRYELHGRNLTIMPDTPYLKSYQIDYPNISRKSKNSISTSANVAGTGVGSASTTSIDNESNNYFWKTLVDNLKDMLRETDKVIPEKTNEATSTQTAEAPAENSLAKASAAALKMLGSNPTTPAQNVAAPDSNTNTRKTNYREAASIIANPETGIISVRATSRQHLGIQEFLNRIMANAKRQVLIEATIVEVTLSDQYQQGIDWSILRSTKGFSATQATPTTSGVMGTLSYLYQGALGGKVDIAASIKLLETFGKLHVLSSPKLSVLNNQTSLLKVVDETVYFTIDVTPGTAATATTAATPATYTSSVHTVPVGFLLYLTPQISNDNEVTLNMRPTITRITNYVSDPNPVLKQNNVSNLIPQIQTREMESILRVHNGEIAVLGGLMQDSRSGTTNQIPGLGNLTGIGEFFKARNDTNTKSELVIFLRPIILDQERQYDVLRQFKTTLSTGL